MIVSGRLCAGATCHPQVMCGHTSFPQMQPGNQQCQTAANFSSAVNQTNCAGAPPPPPPPPARRSVTATACCLLQIACDDVKSCWLGGTAGSSLMPPRVEVPRGPLLRHRPLLAWSPCSAADGLASHLLLACDSWDLKHLPGSSEPPGARRLASHERLHSSPESKRTRTWLWCAWTPTGAHLVFVDSPRSSDICKTDQVSSKHADITKPS